jgi:outer membrane protein assembly factor BamD
MDKDWLRNHRICPNSGKFSLLSLALLTLVFGTNLIRGQEELEEEEKVEYQSYSNTNINLGGVQPELRQPDGEAGAIRWSPESGYYTVGGTLGGLQPEYAQEALDLMNRARAAEERGSQRSALGDYKRVFKHYPASQYAPEARYRTGLIYMERDRYDRAFEEFNIILVGYPTYGNFNLLLGQQYEIASAYVNGYRRKIFGIIPGWTNRDKGAEYFERLVYNAPYSDYAPLSLMNVAVGQLRERNYPYAIDALDRLINAYPNSVVTSDAYLKLAETHAELVEGPLYDQGATREAISYFEDYLILFPTSSGLAEAEDGLANMNEVLAQSKFKMADFYYKKRRNYTAAKVFFNEAITVAPNSQTAATARTRLDEIEVKTLELREKQAQWLQKQIEGENKRRGIPAPTSGGEPTTATIDSEPPPESAKETEPEPAAPQQVEETESEAEPVKPKKRFLGIF